MRLPASFAPLVTPMAIASTTAAPVRVDSNLAAPPVGYHRLGRGMLPISDSKLSNQVYSEASKWMVDAPEDMIYTVGQARDVGQTVQDEAHVPDMHVQIEVNTKRRDTPINPQSQPQPGLRPEGSTDCLDPTKFQANACVAIKLKDRHDADTTGVKVEATTDAAPDGAHKAINVVHVAQEGAPMANDIGSNTPKPTESCVFVLESQPTYFVYRVLAVKDVEGVKPIKT
ncbi:hypothetical protein RSOLAG22IIIB_00305 [Rhizoctonia solani]|uniref:Uncharacterized protein n=1 Tax=Rhizoctonia solani TaxID=456999 RepID=A0A0K6FKX1_9AGAM|nr:hypothetical protein RSOLAG22IIIB_00305 [Rhizoctonia solani]